MRLRVSGGGDFHFIEKVNGIKYLYAWLDKHPKDWNTIHLYLLASELAPAWENRV